ncbi:MULTISPECIES: adenosylcobinamide-GDP ribazoletransferase [unclassified Granulicatella]|uniref:adenosylcobinamide-GDP ribazoletransferase n=1 Tax=unclassified Granulicatella TaxID=2630493 RepID=UPI001073196B|nr:MULTISPECIES: adenosylcobinamide-GDP ribazoletransferase [unclassified Granulicatella]MBF0779536.1 adenosylcobinamide-GDP ribazoletransferase [Granulicatella sp. 19428wC4_WM01]TFU96501.1 adenosylcobinamide-GDP ribazoletransferase [Granulicatella sp. WM01]
MISSLIIFTQFFSRIPIHKEVDYHYLSKGIRWISLFGLLLGGISAGVFMLVRVFFPLPIAWVVALITDILLTSGFHLDALADMADGLFSSRTKEKMLEIMKDSRVGSNGVIALILYIVVYVMSIHYVALSDWQYIALVAVLSMIGKGALALQLVNMVYARSQSGLGHVFCGTKTQDIMYAQILPICVSGACFGWKGLLAYGLVCISALGYRKFVYSKIQGHTGDTLGAFVEIAHIVFMLGLMI